MTAEKPFSISAVLQDLVTELPRPEPRLRRDNSQERVAEMERNYERHGEEWAPFKLGNITRELGSRLFNDGDAVGAASWLRQSERVWERCVALAPNSDNEAQLARVSGLRAEAEDSLAPSERASAILTQEALSTAAQANDRPPKDATQTRTAETRPSNNSFRDDALSFLRMSSANQESDAALQAVAAALNSVEAPEPVPLVVDRAREFAARICQVIAASEAVQSVVGPAVRADLERLASVVTDTTLPPNAQQVRSLAVYARRRATPRDIQPTDPTPRLWWLLAGACNLELVEGAHKWTASAPQNTQDVLGYVTAVVIQHRYDDAARDFLPAAAEQVVRVAVSLPPAFWPMVTRWCRTALGLYLILRGPDPANPAETMYDERIRTVDRDDWARQLLNRYKNGQSESERVTVTVALCQIAGEDPMRLEWLLNLVFGPQSEDPDAADLAYWLDRGLEFIRKAARLRIVVNPWAPPMHGADDPSALSTLVARRTNDDTVKIPSRLVQHAAAEVLRLEEAVSINGQRFAGRRVPTFLVRNAAGPFGLLKIDTAEKVEREYRNFTEAAQHLHWNNRPGMSRRGALTIYTADDATPLQAILTSHVFGEHDTPTTLGDWLKHCSASEAQETLERLFLGALRPWIAYVSRERVDLRMEYPVLRPRVPTRGSYAPHQSSRSELERIRSSALWAPVSELGSNERGFNFLLNEAADLGDLSALPLADDAIDPLWLAAQIASAGHDAAVPGVSDLIDELVDYETLVARCHGDLHVENALCLESESRTPRLVLIDFESTHRGHVCKDFARLEAALLCQLHDWTNAQQRTLLEWFSSRSAATSWSEGADTAPDDPVGVVRSSAERLRALARGCGQGHWELSPKEYAIALFGALLPLSRYATVSPQNQLLALALSSTLANELCVRP